MNKTIGEIFKTVNIFLRLIFFVCFWLEQKFFFKFSFSGLKFVVCTPSSPVSCSLSLCISFSLSLSLNFFSLSISLSSLSLSLYHFLLRDGFGLGCSPPGKLWAEREPGAEKLPWYATDSKWLVRKLMFREKKGVLI